MKLMAQARIRKGGRWIEPGEAFDIRSSGEAKALKALGRAVDYVEPPQIQHLQDDPERDALRVRAAALGIDVDGRWGAARLQEEIAAAEERQRRRGRYFRMDMTAERSGGEPE